MPPIQKQAINLNFGQGIDTKTDPNQVELGKLLSLTNSVFDEGGALKKRNGFAALPALPDATATFVATHNDNLLTLGNNLQVFAADTRQWYTKGTFQDVDLNVNTLVRTTNSQETVDSAIAPNLAVCSVYLDSSGSCYYTVSDSLTGEIIIVPTILPATAAFPRVSALGSFFVITYLVTVAGVTHLEYIALPIYNPQTPGTRITLATNVNSLTAGYDVVVANNNMYFSWWSNAGVSSSYIDYTLLQHIVVNIPAHTADLVSLSADLTTSTPTIYLTFWQSSDTSAYTAIYDANLNVSVAATLVLATTVVLRITSAAQFQSNRIFYEVQNFYPHNPTIPTNFIRKNTIDSLGVVTVSSIIDRSVGLASKGFVLDGKVYVMSVYAGALQPTYFLLDEFGNVIAKLAYSNGSGYGIDQILPQGNVSGSIVQIGYLLKDLLAPVNKSINAPNVNGIYAQTGVNLASFFLNSGFLSTNEIAGALMITGGFPWMYDGNKPVEHSFYLYPEDLTFSGSADNGGMLAQQYYYAATYEWTDATGQIHRSAPSVPIGVNLTPFSGTPITFTSVFNLGDTLLTVSSTAGLFVGQVITDVTTGGNIQPGTTITAIGTTTITISLPTAGASAAGPGDTLQTVDTASVTLYVPTLRLTYKVAPTDVRIVIYRWSTALPIFYQITSIPAPILNSKVVDDITYVDTQNDGAIIGNLILYTTGGVLENIQAPACSVSTLFKSRYFVVDSEDKNLIWYSKTVLESTPVETTDLQTIFVAPTTGAQGSTGPITALSSMDDKLIIFKRDAIYYVTGNGPDITGANNDYGDPVFVTSSVGCTNQNSIVLMPDGLMFQSDKGIWILKRDLSTFYIGAGVEAFNSVEVLSALTIPGTNQVRFTLEGQNPTLMYDYYFQQWGEFAGIPGLSSTLYQGLHTFINQYGEVYQESAGVYLDGSRPVIMSFTTAWAKLAGLQGFQRVYFFYLLGKFLSPHKLTLNIAYDYNPSPTQQVIISPINFSGFYGDDPIYGDQTPYGGPGSVEQWRVFLTQQKCESIQISLLESFDDSYNTAAGAGLTLSGINLIYGVKKGYMVLAPSLSVG